MVVAVGVTLRLPEASGVTAPTPWSIEALSAPSVVQLRVVDSPPSDRERRGRQRRRDHPLIINVEDLHRGAGGTAGPLAVRV